MRFAVGLIVGLLVGGVAGAGAAYLYYHRHRDVKVVTAPVVTDAGVVAKKKPHKRHQAGDPGASSPTEVDDPTITLTAADTQNASEGDTLKAANRVMDMTAGAPEARDLSQDEINDAVNRRSGAIVKCITDARGNAPLTGHISVGVVVGPDGGILKTRVDAPSYLIHHGLGGCVRPQLAALRFPAAGRETVVTVPFDLHETP